MSSLGAQGTGHNSMGDASDSGGRSRAPTIAAPAEMRIDLTFNNLGVELASGLKILHGITGSMKSGHMTAIMGPSGVSLCNIRLIRRKKLSI